MNKFVISPSLAALLCLSFWAGRMPSARADSLCKAIDGETIAATPTDPACAGLPQPEVGRRSLTVIGQGQVTAPADTALLEFRFGSRESANSATTDAPGLSIEAARKVTDDALKPTVNALIAAGVPARNITIQTSAIQNPKMQVKLEKPTQERVQQIVLTVDRSLKSSQQLFLNGVGAGYAVNACEPLERSARRIALQDAQRQIITLAQDVKVKLGELLSVTVLPLTGAAASTSCGTKVGVPVSPLSFTADESTPPYNPSDRPEVKVRSQVSVTYGMQS